MKTVKRIVADQSCGVIVDLQAFFLAQIDKKLSTRIRTNTSHFIRLLNYFQIPILVTLERPIERKGTLPNDIARTLTDRTPTLEKNFFDLTKEATIRSHLAGLKRKQAVVVGCETDVCVLQSCLGLMNLGHDVFVVEELIFSSTRNVAAAMARMETEGAVFISYKTLFYELLESVDGNLHADKMRESYGPFPADLPDAL